LEAEKKSRSLALLGMTKSIFSAACEARATTIETQLQNASDRPIICMRVTDPRRSSKKVDDFPISGDFHVALLNTKG
jgi:hypothetical protein